MQKSAKFKLALGNIRAFFVGKGMKRFSFWPAAIVGAVLFAAAHYAAGAPGIVAWDLGGIFIDAILFAILYRKTGNCLISFIPHFLNNMIGFFLVPILFG
jgi:membrane protease YdiL (CAAX protease family)